MQSLFSHLPKIWKEVDLLATQVINGQGMLERFLGVGDQGFVQVQSFIEEFLRSHNSEEIRDQFLPLLVDLTGEYWNNGRTRQWNRNRIQSSIPRASYKGTTLAVLDLAREYGASYCTIVDMASKCAVEGRQGTYGEDDNTFINADYYHAGVYQVFITDDADLDGFLVDFQHLKPTGTKWYIRTLVDSGAIVSKETTISEAVLLTTLDEGVNFGSLWWTNDSNYYDYVPQWGVEPQIIL